MLRFPCITNTAAELTTNSSNSTRPVLSTYAKIGTWNGPKNDPIRTAQSSEVSCIHWRSGKNYPAVLCKCTFCNKKKVGYTEETDWKTAKHRNERNEIRIDKNWKERRGKLTGDDRKYTILRTCNGDKELEIEKIKKINSPFSILDLSWNIL